jgi:hypothetical protein
MSKSEFKKMLQSMDKGEIISLVVEMYDTKKEIKDYLDYVTRPNEKEQFEKAKQIVENEYFPSKGFPKARLSVAKKAVTDFSKLKPSPELEAELMMFLVECGCQFTHEYGDISETFYSSMEKNFGRAMQFIEKHNLTDKFRPNAEHCLEWSADCGWGFADEIAYIFYEYYPE